MDPTANWAQGSAAGAVGVGVGSGVVGSGSGDAVEQGIVLTTGSEIGPQPLALRAWTATLTVRHGVWTVMVTRRTDGAKVFDRHSLHDDEPG
jgi:hypothetical protein